MKLTLSHLSYARTPVPSTPSKFDVHSDVHVHFCFLSGGTILSGAASFATPTTGWETALAHEFIDKIPGGVPWAAKLAVEAIQKLWSALGKDQKSQVLDQAAKTKGTQALANWLYQVPTLDETVNAKVKAAEPGKTGYERINNGTRRLDQLLGRYSTTTKILSWVLRGIEFC